MSIFTYESEDTAKQLETWEWDNTWWEHTEDKTTRRFLYIGDSISCRVRHFITEMSQNTILCDGFGTSKGLDNPHFQASIDLFMAQQGHCDVILFNNGLHGWHLTNEAYEAYYEKMLQFLAQKEKPVYILLTTNEISNPNRGPVIDARNAAATKLAKKFGFPVIDLHTIAANNLDCYSPDGVHFIDRGYELLANCILEATKV